MINPLEQINPFFWISFFVGIVYVVVYFFPRVINIHKGGHVDPKYTNGKVRYRLLQILTPLLCIAMCLTVWFETYLHSYQCRVSPSYYQHNLDTSQKVIKLLREIKAPIFADFATLLGVIRGQEINIWDHDTDFSMVHPGDEGIKYITDVLSHPSTGLKVDFLPKRNLMQISPKGVKKGPHTDIFFWDDKYDKNGVRILESPDTISIDKPIRYYYDLFPLQDANWAGVPVSVPFDTHAVCANEFGHFGGSYMEPLVFRRDCLHNTFNFRWLPF